MDLLWKGIRVIHIGNKIWVTDQVSEVRGKGYISTLNTIVYFNGKPMEGVQSFIMNWNSYETVGKKWCSMLATKKTKELAMEFISELTKYGFGGEIVTTDSIIEYYFEKGQVIKEIKTTLPSLKLGKIVV